MSESTDQTVSAETMTAEQLRAIIDQCKTSTEAGRKLGLSRQAVSGLVRKHGIIASWMGEKEKKTPKKKQRPAQRFQAPTAAAPEAIDHPAHYQGNGLEAIQVIEAFGLDFHLGNVVKYILRAGKKGSRQADLGKAQWYLTRAMEQA